MTPRATILFLSQCLPYPPHTGVTNRTFNVLKQLARDFDIVLLPYFRSNHQPTPEARRAACRRLEQFVARVCTPVAIPAERSRLRRVWDHVRGLCAGRAYTYFEYESALFRDQLRLALAQEKPDLVHIDNLVDLHRWVPALPPLPQACTHHNVESELLRTRAARTRWPILARYVRRQARLVEQLERDCCPRFGLNVVMSSLDGDRLKTLAPSARIVVAPNGVDLDYFRPQNAEVVPGRVVFLGPMYMFPNREGMAYFLEEIWPMVRMTQPSASLRIIGPCSESHRVRYEREPGVECLGYVQDIRPHLAQASCCVVPLRIGGGTRLKMLDSWAMGKAVVSTSLGCEGLKTVDGDNLLIRDDPEDFAAAVVAVLTEQGLRAKLQAGARRTVEESYGWEQVGHTLRHAYRELLGRSGEPSRPDSEGPRVAVRV